MSDTTLKTFPSDAYEALAMLYVSKQDLTDVSPEGLYTMYKDAKERMVECQKAMWEAERESRQPYPSIFR